MADEGADAGADAPTLGAKSGHVTPIPTREHLLLRPRDHEDAARVAITWLAQRHRKGWRNAFEELLDDWRPEGSEDGSQLDKDGMTMASINVGERLIARSQIQARGGLRKYEDGEQRPSAEQGRAAVSYQFLWDGLGISK